MKKQKLEITILEANDDLSNLREGDLVYAAVDRKGDIEMFRFKDIAVYGGTLKIHGQEVENRHAFIYTLRPLDVNSKVTVLAAERVSKECNGAIYGFNALDLKDFPEYENERIRLIDLARKALTK